MSEKTERIEGLLRAATATPPLRVADTEYNAKEIIRCMKEAAGNGAELLVLPELSVTAYTCGDLFLQSALLSAAEQALSEICRETRELPLLTVLGFPLRAAGKLYNTAAVLLRGRLLGFVPKRNIPSYGEFYESRWFERGEAAVRLLPYTDFLSGESYEVPFGGSLLFSAEDRPGFVLAAEICEDVWVPSPPSALHAQAGATVIANCSASDETVGKSAYRRMLISAISARLLCGYLYANAGAGESTQDMVFGGQSLIAENGRILTESARFRTGLQYAELDLELLGGERKRISSFPSELGADEGYMRIPFRLGESPFRKHIRFIDPHPFVPEAAEQRRERCEEILSIQAMGLKKRIEHIDCKTAVLGISGGLDSTLALLVTARAFDMLGLPRENILCVTMPAFGTTDRTYRNAICLTERLHASIREIDIKKSVLCHFEDLGHDPENHNVVYENAQARERTQILMDLANAVNGIVIGTGDLSELALGWATYNGDHMSMYAVNAGVPKTLVRHLVSCCAETAEDPLLQEILRDVLDTPVSPELLPPSEGGMISQRTEELVGPYELHDFFLYQILRFGFAPGKIYAMALQAFGAGAEQEESENGAFCREAGCAPARYSREEILKWLKRFYRRFFSQQFKRSCLPDGPKVGSVAVSPRGDLRMPSDAAVRVWLRELEAIEEEERNAGDGDAFGE